ncbi:hypothetical protein F5146DRAFT_1153455 [Armillaria mellea]|nr:hypothetical protein F5146DRAFT_1153455 [Armillaria mellea]
MTAFAQSHLIRRLKPFSFNALLVTRSLHKHINRMEGVEIESFDVTSRDEAKKVHDALLNRRFDYICNPVLWLRIPPQALYTITIPFRQYRAQEDLWKELQGNIKGRKTCDLIIRESNDVNRRIQVSGMVKAALGALQVRVESLAAGEKINGWHDHLTYPRIHLVQKITETGAFFRSDYWKRTLKLYGEPKAVEKAEVIVMEEFRVSRL